MFEIGDKVLCIDGHGNSLKLGRIYTVATLLDKNNQINLKELQFKWFVSRFILATPLIEALI